ncbi:MAG: hypothetical protein HC796_10975 [Synechococcaceae cyanobacterium RL_1_2]|nr:hypothetical protein [Synechococcaceae cyanobacterium RL_1_2]
MPRLQGDKYDKSDKYGDGKDSKGDKYDKSDKYGDGKDSKGDKYDRCEEIDAGIEINKVTNGQDDLSVVAGAAITWTYEVTNTGNVALRNVIVVDDNGTAGDTSDDFKAINFTGDNNGNGLLDPGEKWVYTVESTAVEGAYSNIGTVSADYPGTNSNQNNLRYGISHVIYRLDDGSTFKVDQYTGDIKNSADPTKYIAAIEDRTGKSVASYTIKAGQYYFDRQGNKISPVSHQADCTVNASQLSASEIKNTITITDSDASNYFGTKPIIEAAPDIDVEKYVSFDNGITWLDADTVADGPDVASGNNPQFKFMVTNIGNVALQDIVLKDDTFDLNGSAPGTQIQFATLEVGATKEFIFTDAQWQLGQHTNTATVTGVYKQEVIGSPTVRHYTIDFDKDSQGNTLAAGTIIDDEYKGWGVTISTNKPYGTMIFDSANPTGGDYDLATTSEKNILIISEDGDRNDPDDEACGGSIIFKFDDAVEIKSIGLVDIEESGGKIYTTDKDGNVKVTNIPGVGNNSLQTLTIDDGDVVKVEVVLKGSGAISGLNFNRVLEGGTGSETIIVGDQDSANYFGVNPAIAIDKVTNGADGQQIVAGSNITWTYTVVNQGNVALANIVVTDDQEGLATYVSGDNGNNVLDTGETWIYEIQGTATLGNYANIGTVQGKYIDDLGNVVNLSQADGSSYFGFEEFIPNPAIAIDKVTNGADDQAILAGANITWTYTVVNEGNTALSNVTVTDDKEGVATYVSGDNGNNILDVAETWVYEIQGTAGVGNYSNLGTATGQYVDSSGNVTNLLASDGSGYFGANPAIAIDKVTNGADGQEILAGANITWTYTVANEGNTALSNVTVTDDKEGVATYVSGIMVTTF